MIMREVMPSCASASACARVRPAITVPNGTPRAVWPCGSKKNST